MKKGSALAVFLALVLSFAPLGCASRTPKSAAFYAYFDTVATVTCYGADDEDTFSRRAALTESVLKKYHRLFDIYHEYEGVVNLAAVNREAGRAPVAVSDELFSFLLFMKDTYAVTEGKTNAAMGAVLSLWHECRASDAPVLPASSALSEAAKHTDMADVILDAEKKTVYFADGALSLDVGAIGKGYAVERAAEALTADGAEGYLLDVGGNLRAVGGKNGTDPFSVGIYNPTAEDGGYAAIVSLSDASCVTSGSYQRYVEIDGVRYAHIIDPATLYPAGYFVSVTVVTEDSGMADALSTALFCLSEEDGDRLAASVGGIRVIRVAPDGTVTDVTWP